MSDQSQILSMPYIQPAQAQKHVTHNEAIRVLDALVQLSVEDRDQTAPPASPTSGDRHIVGAGATGDWASKDGSIAVYDDGGWRFYEPQGGWLAVVRSEGVSLIWTGTTWAAPGIDASALQNVDSIGVNTTADATNRLSVSADATLLSNAGTDHRVVVNKAAMTDTASLLFQTNYAGRAEMGTAGSDDFAIKVSADSSTWNTAVTFDQNTGTAQFPSGAKVANRIDFGGRWYCYTNNRWVTHSPTYGIQTENNNASAGTDAEPALAWTQIGAQIPKDAQLQNFTASLRPNFVQVVGFDLRIFFQTGTWATEWATDGATQRTVVASEDNISVNSGFIHYESDLGQLIAPDNGFLIVMLRPVGTLTATRYLYAAMTATYLSPR